MNTKPYQRRAIILTIKNIVKHHCSALSRVFR